MSEEWEELLIELKKMPRGVESAPQYLRHIMKMFVADFEMSVSKRLDMKYWSKLKKMMDEMRKASENDRVVDLNVQNLAMGFMTELSLLVDCHYEIPSFGQDISPHMRWNSPVYSDRKPVKSKKNSRVFMAYILLRIGDLMRYKDCLPKARELYEQSCRINPADGAVWNQLGLISVLSAQYLESVYFHTRALHASLEFPSATGSLTTIFKKFANRDISKSMPVNELYLSCLAKIHFLLEIENSETLLQTISEKLATSKEIIVSLMSVYEHLEDGTELEQRAVGYISTIWTISYRILLETLANRIEEAEDVLEISNLLHLLTFFHSAPKLLEEIEESETSGDVRTVVDWLMTSGSSDDVISDTDGFRYFHCLEERQYPLKKSHLIEIFKGTIVDESEGTEFNTSTEQASSNSSSPLKSTSRSPVKAQRREDPESSDEEILQRGRRRGRAPRLNESNDTDDELF
ncbi:hypothetical protein CRE_24664 [Caenorhabditis remanei]|uniref:DNA/RNA-binding domain-containing protein n=1 Tax=Caenorhabditis remanei TaxID=31234 RepID=E3N3Z0_CAERE|nr:hypothetical protein CRE_24664 [Caenorhabditis remanei]